MVVAVERLAGYMAQIDAAMESMKEKKLAAKETQARRGSSRSGSSNRGADEREDTETSNKIKTASIDEVQRRRTTPVEDVLERREVREALDIVEQRARPAQRKSIDPSDEVVTRRLSKDSAFNSVELDKVPSMVEFPANFVHDDPVKGHRIDSVVKKLQMFCFDIYCSHPFSVLENNSRSHRIEYLQDFD
ncbi:hypothetical protein MPSEU_000701000 [Mayamaea pseudoterrestris]|nr:hypothetical protein MPSEU_000701000 [Mayamaea pseudoterrestris]